jgi:hypothetical protein
MIEKTMENLPSSENQIDTLGEHKPKKRKLLFFILIFPLCLSLVLFLWSREKQNNSYFAEMCAGP